MTLPQFHIDLKEQFPTLKVSSISDAILAFELSPSEAWNGTKVEKAITESLQEYHDVKQRSEQTNTNGWQCRTKDKKRIVRFYHEQFLFAQLHPYPSWPEFSGEALRLWSLHQNEIHSTIDKIKLRFLNKISIPFKDNNVDLGQYLFNAPEMPQGLPDCMIGFLHQHFFNISPHRYKVKLITTTDEYKANANEFILILDTSILVDFDDTRSVEDYLNEMRWIKNKIFFGSIKPEAYL